MSTKTITGHGIITVEHVEGGVVLRQESPLGAALGAVFVPYDRADVVIEAMRPPSAPKLVE